MIWSGESQQFINIELAGGDSPGRLPQMAGSLGPPPLANKDKHVSPVMGGWKLEGWRLEVILKALFYYYDLMM